MKTYLGVFSDELGARICARVLLGALAVSSVALLPAPRTIRPLFLAGRSSRVCICGILSIQLLLKKLSLFIWVAVVCSPAPLCRGKSLNNKNLF
jgi:hypothetical protein